MTNDCHHPLVDAKTLRCVTCGEPAGHLVKDRADGQMTPPQKPPLEKFLCPTSGQYWDDRHFDDDIHVIEYSAYDKLKAERDELKRSEANLIQCLGVEARNRFNAQQKVRDLKLELSASADQRERHLRSNLDQALEKIARLEEALSHLPKVPTQPYEKEMAQRIERLEDENENLKMVCRRLSAASKLEVRDRIAKQCAHLFAGSILRKGEAGDE